MFVCDVHDSCESSRLRKPSQKTSKRLQKSSNAYKIRKTRSLCFWMFRQYAKQNWKIWAFCCFLHSSHRIKSLEKIVNDGKFERCACAHHHADWGAPLILCETIWNSSFFPWPKFCNQCRGAGHDRKFKVAGEGIKFTTGFWRYRPKRLLCELVSREE